MKHVSGNWIPFLLIVWGFILGGCAVPPPVEPVRVGGLVLYNDTRYTLQDVRLQVPKTGGFISCGLILPGKQCATTFPSRHYRGAPVVITWLQAGQQLSSGKIRIQSRKKPVTGKVATVYATVYSDGTVEARVE